MRQQKLTARKRILARPRPVLILVEPQLNASVADLILPDGVGQREALSSTITVGIGPSTCGRGCGCGHGRFALDELAQLAQAFEEGDHGAVEAAVHEFGEAEGELAGGVEFEGGDLRRVGRSGGGGGGGGGTGCGGRRRWWLL